MLKFQACYIQVNSYENSQYICETEIEHLYWYSNQSLAWDMHVCQNHTKSSKSIWSTKVGAEGLIMLTILGECYKL